MKNNTESLPIDRKSHFSNNRDSYVDENGNYVYTQWIKRPNGKWERVVTDIVPLTEKNKDIIILLDQNDHDTDLQERYVRDHEDYGIRNQRDNRHGSSEDEDDFDTDPIDSIADPNSDVFDQLYPVEQPVNPKVKQVNIFVNEKLGPKQQDMYYAHFGERKYLEDIRREESVATGKEVTKQAVHGRWNRIITKVCKEFGVDKPKQKKLNKE
ncbi:MAG: hypothetical protein LUE92_01800 [Clostridiales bacterium]|nr:hypothetical protein [Clostridiales bacterium]